MKIKKLKEIFIKNSTEIILFIFALGFSIWLMFSTFSYSNGSMLIASKAWSDFASQIPLIRSFSFGHNFPPQHPLFPGPPIHYHFLFYAFVGLLEKLGVRIDYALNIPSAIGFFGLILMIYFFSKAIFKSKAVSILSVIFFLFNGSLSFIYFFTDHPMLQNFFTSLIQNNKFSSFGPYDNRIVSAFWNLNIYTNQRHLALSFALSLLIIIIFLTPVIKKTKPKIKISLLLGAVLGLSFFLHFAVFLMTIIVLIMLSVFYPKLRTSGLVLLFTAAVISFPQYSYLQHSGGTFKSVFNPGYLISNNLSFASFFNYWSANLGLNIILIPLGFIVAPKNARKILIAFLPLFIVGNLIQFSPEIAANHKFFNYFLIIGNMFSAFFIVYFWQKKFYLRPLLIVLIFLLIFSGIIDFFPISNDSKIALADYPQNKDIAWIMKNTLPNSIFLNSQFLYDPASMAGRKIFLGWPYFAWSEGYDTNTRGDIMKLIMTENDQGKACLLLKNNNIRYVEVNSLQADPNLPTYSNLYLSVLSKEYVSNNGTYFIINVKDNCKK